MTEEIKKLFIEAKEEIEMPREKLLEKLWDLQQRVDDAIEYIKINTYENIYKTKVVNANDLLEILEGGINE